MKKIINNINLIELKALAKEIASSLKVGDVLCLYGDLGTGKTTFSGMLINSLIDTPQNITSPTFNLVHTYDSPKGQIWHFDMYRLKSAEEAYEIGIEDALMHAISIIEWPEIVEPLLPQERVSIHFSHNSKGEFCISLEK